MFSLFSSFLFESEWIAFAIEMKPTREKKNESDFEFINIFVRYGMYLYAEYDIQIYEYDGDDADVCVCVGSRN